MITYLILANLFLAICYGFYHLFLSQETFFQSNRLFLLSGIFVAFSLPLVDMGTVFGDATATYHVHLPVIQIGEATSYDADAGAGLSSALDSAVSSLVRVSVFYWAGCLISGLIFLYKLVMTIRFLRKGTGAQGYSFFGRIRVDKSVDTDGKIEQHERVHVRQWHSLDVLLVELVKVFNWFNPVVYLYARALKLQHEYIADRETSVGQPVQYAELLLSKAFGASIPLLATPFAESSFLKPRIQMLLKSASKRTALAKFVLVIPMLVAMLAVSMSFSGTAHEGKQIDEEAIRAFKEEIGRHTPYPQAAMDEGLSAIVWATYKKKGGKYLEIGFLDDSQVDFHAAVRRTLERESTQVVAPEGSNMVEVRFSIVGEAEAAMPPPPPPVEPPGYTDLGQVNIVAYTSTAKSSPETADTIFEDVEVSPEPPGGYHAFRQWIAENYRYPKAAIDAGVNGTVEVTFVVERDGSLTDIRLNRDLGHGTGEEAIRVLKGAGKWAPGVQNGGAVRVAYTLPIRLATG